jgi:hypothetical protein
MKKFVDSMHPSLCRDEFFMAHYMQLQIAFCLALVKFTTVAGSRPSTHWRHPSIPDRYEHENIWQLFLDPKAVKTMIKSS